ncbi:MAG TPA: alpha/beta fold hydrolase [Chryseosolibacter sp.]
MLKIVQRVYPRLEKWVPWLAHRFFIAVFFTPLNYRVPEKERALEDEAVKFTLLVRGKKIQGYSWGSGPVVLLVHGWAGRATQFRKIIHALVDAGYQAVAFDGPAHGHSQGTSTNIDEFEDALKTIWEKTGPPQAIIAHSFGGGVVLQSAMNGLPVRKLINIASPTIGDEIIKTYLRTINGSPATGEFFRSYVQRKSGKPFDAFTALYFIERIKPDLDLLLIHDENDEEVSLRHALELVKRYPKARLFKTSGLGHTRLLKDEAVIEKCLSFIGERT